MQPEEHSREQQAILGHIALYLQAGLAGLGSGLLRRTA